MSTPRFVTIAFALVVGAAQVLQAQNNGDSEAEEPQPSRYQLQDILSRWQPSVHVAGNADVPGPSRLSGILIR